MLLSLQWLREFVPYEGTGLELGDRLTMAGLEMDGISRPYDALKPIVVGYVAECGRHPNADSLSVCRVDVGDEVLDIVCGAPNVAQGQKVAVVKVGVTLPTGLTVKKAKLRGAPSHGMICSEFELGLSEEHDGILVLDANAKVGASLTDVLGLDDEVLDISVTPNRGDCLSVLGLAREVSALLGLPLTRPSFTRHDGGENAASLLHIDIPQPDLCPLYHAMVIENAVVRPAPHRMRYRLNSIGVRPISNLVDATNYILMELGQPLHAFDLDTLRGGRIIVRGADAGERFTTLDGQERTLTPEDITIRDAEGIVCLGGVMGGLNSEITGKSTRVFLESAIFNPPNIRKTARRLGISSEAAFRFERGVDQLGADFALERAAHLMAELSGGFVRPGVMKADPRPFAPVSVSLRKERAEKLLGISLDTEFCEQTLTKLGCVLERKEDTPPVWNVTAPSHRPDITREADCVEELARMYGVDRIPPTLPLVTPGLERAGMPENKHDWLMRIKHWACGIGLNESISYSFVSHKDLDFLGLPGEGRISIMNPLSDDMNVLRPHLAPGMLNALRNNLSQSAGSVRLFEVATSFVEDRGSPTTAKEGARLGILLCGNRYDQAWPRESADLDYQDLKGCLEHFLAATGIGQGEFVLSEQTMPWLSPCVDILVNNSRIGFAGCVKPDLADRYHAKKPVWMAEIDLEVVRKLYDESRITFTPLAVFPPVRRDITFIAPVGISAQAVADAVKAMKLPLLSDVRLIDCFEPKDKDERNLTYRLTFRHAERTLKDSEADKQRDTIAAKVSEALGVRV